MVRSYLSPRVYQPIQIAKRACWPSSLISLDHAFFCFFFSSFVRRITRIFLLFFFYICKNAITILYHTPRHNVENVKIPQTLSTHVVYRYIYLGKAAKWEVMNSMCVFSTGYWTRTMRKETKLRMVYINRILRTYKRIIYNCIIQ